MMLTLIGVALMGFGLGWVASVIRKLRAAYHEH